MSPSFTCTAAGCDSPANRGRLCQAHSDARRHDGDIALLVQILRNTPRLRGAACQGSRYHDGETPEHVALAIEICSSCPALTPCTEWSRDEARKRRTPIGMVTAGRHHQSTNPKKENQPC